MITIPIQLNFDQWREFSLMLGKAIADADFESNILPMSVKAQKIELKLMASLLNEMKIKADVAIGKQRQKYTMKLTHAQALALHLAYTKVYLQSNDPFFNIVLSTKIIPPIDKAV